jgi:hypothetical protein
MSSDRVGYAVTIMGSMVLVGSALIARRGSWNGGGGKMALAWVAIILLMVLAGWWLDGMRGLHS